LKGGEYSVVTTEATLIHSTPRTAGQVHRLGEFASYREAEQVLERLSDVGFPVERARIVDPAVHTVDQTARRFTMGRATSLGAGLGAWLGLSAGLTQAILVAGVAWTVLVGALLMGAAAGALLGFVFYWATSWPFDVAHTGRPAQRYAVEVDRTHAVEAVQALDRS
jgi:hypothetical protein